MSTFSLFAVGIAGYGLATFGKLGYDVYRAYGNRRILDDRMLADKITSPIYAVAEVRFRQRFDRYGIPRWGKGSRLTRRQRKQIRARFFEQ